MVCFEDFGRCSCKLGDLGINFSSDLLAGWSRGFESVSDVDAELAEFDG